MRRSSRMLAMLFLCAASLSSTSCLILGAVALKKSVDKKKAAADAVVLPNPVFQGIERDGPKIAGMIGEVRDMYPALANMNEYILCGGNLYGGIYRNLTRGIYPDYENRLERRSWALVLTNNSLFICDYGKPGITYPYFDVWLEVPFQMIKSIIVARHDPPTLMPNPNLLTDKEQVIAIQVSEDLIHQTGIGWKNGRTPSALAFTLGGFGKDSGNIKRLQDLVPGVTIETLYKSN